MTCRSNVAGKESSCCSNRTWFRWSRIGGNGPAAGLGPGLVPLMPQRSANMRVVETSQMKPWRVFLFKEGRFCIVCHLKGTIGDITHVVSCGFPSMFK